MPGPDVPCAVTRVASDSIDGGSGRVQSGACSTGGCSGSKGSEGAPAANTSASWRSYSAWKPSQPIDLIRNFIRFLALCWKSPSLWNTRTIASAAASMSPTGRNSCSGAADRHIVAVPPPAATRNPRSTLPCSSTRVSARQPMSWIAVSAWSSRQPSKATLNFLGSTLLSG